MADVSTKPYFIRAIYEWCSDCGYTPYLSVRVDEKTRIPMEYVKNGEIVLNVSLNATRNLTINNELIQFSARFNGVSQEVSVPMTAVAGIFAKETGYGFAFTVTQDPVASLTSATEPSLDRAGAVADDKAGDAKPKSRPSHLQVIK